jgi:hypothetical protein
MIVIRNWIAMYSDIFHIHWVVENYIYRAHVDITFVIDFVCLVFQEIQAQLVLIGYSIISFLDAHL